VVGADAVGACRFRSDGAVSRVEANKVKLSIRFSASAYDGFAAAPDILLQRRCFVIKVDPAGK